MTACQGLIEKSSLLQPVTSDNVIIDIDDEDAATADAFIAGQQPQQSVPSPILAIDLWQRIRRDMHFVAYEHPRITREIKRLQRNPASLNRLLGQAEPYLYYIVEQVERNNLPGEIALLPAVESGFRPQAYSRLGAAGLWQFMPATGRMLGLRQDWWYDGRRDIAASTRAAMDYLTRLNRRFDGDWLYALAAYNAGAGTVSRAIRKARNAGQPTDYWSLSLPKETRDYIPRLIALAKIIHDPTEYALNLPELEDAPYFEITQSDKQIDLQTAAELAGVSLQTLTRLNPGFRRGVTYPPGSNQLLLPLGRRMTFDQALAALPDQQRLRWRRHKVNRGETLSQIARRYNLPVGAIRQANRLSGSRIRINQKLLIPLRQSAVIAQVQRDAAKPRVRYRVRKGDSLYAIARKFRVKVADLKRWNKVQKYLRPGQQITVYTDST